MRTLLIPRRQQRGATLIIAMVFLLIFAIVAATSLRSSMSSVQAISNMQFRNEGVAAANDAIDLLLSSDKFAKQTDAVTADFVNAPYTVDINGDDVADIEVTFPEVMIAGVKKAGPRCVRQRPVPASSLDPTRIADVPCIPRGAADGSGLAVLDDASGETTPVDGATYACADTQWVIPVRATDAVTNTSVDVSQGTSIRVAREDALNSCN